MTYKTEISIYLILIPLVGVMTGLISYGAYRLIGYPESRFVLFMMIAVWGGVCLALGVCSTIRCLKQKEELNDTHL